MIDFRNKLSILLILLLPTVSESADGQLTVEVISAEAERQQEKNLEFSENVQSHTQKILHQLHYPLHRLSI